MVFTMIAVAVGTLLDVFLTVNFVTIPANFGICRTDLASALAAFTDILKTDWIITE